MTSEEQIRQCAKSLVGIIKDTEEQIERCKQWLMRHPQPPKDDPFGRERHWNELHDAEIQAQCYRNAVKFLIGENVYGQVKD